MTRPLKFRLKNSLLLFSFFLLSLSLTAQPILKHTLSPSSIFKELQRDSILSLVLETDTKHLVKTKNKEEWQAMRLKLNGTNNEPIEYKGKVRTRGNIRKKICYYPPLKLKFKKEWLAAQGMDSTFNDLKLVIGCKKNAFYDKLVLKEYLVYQLYAALTDYSFKTQLVSLKMIDTGGSWEPVETIAFLIENDDELAASFNGRCTKPSVMRSKSIDPSHWAFLALFEYMIGNTDYAMPNSHNIRYIVTRDQPKVIPIAYDFDYSGLVKAPYAVHRESLNIENITERYFQGSCKTKAYFAQHLPLFQEKKETLYQIINDFALLDERSKNNMLKYLEEFFELIDKEKSFKRQIIDQCLD